jgi:hypothetical protein
MDFRAACAERVQEAHWLTYMVARNVALRKKSSIQTVKNLKTLCIVIGVTRKI